MGVPWRAVESMHWHLGEQEMARRAGATPFTMAAASGPNTSGSAASTSAPVSRAGSEFGSGGLISGEGGVSGVHRNRRASAREGMRLPSVAELECGVSVSEYARYGVEEDEEEEEDLEE